MTSPPLAGERALVARDSRQAGGGGGFLEFSLLAFAIVDDLCETPGAMNPSTVVVVVVVVKSSGMMPVVGFFYTLVAV